MRCNFKQLQDLGNTFIIKGRKNLKKATYQCQQLIECYSKETFSRTEKKYT